VHRLDQDQAKVWARQAQWDPRKAGSGAHVGNRLAVIEQFGEYGAVEHVTVPDPVALTRTDQAPLGPDRHEELCVALCEGEPVAEQRLRGRL